MRSEDYGRMTVCGRLTLVVEGRRQSYRRGQNEFKRPSADPLEAIERSTQAFVLAGAHSRAVKDSSITCRCDNRMN